MDDVGEIQAYQKIGKKTFHQQLKGTQSQRTPCSKLLHLYSGFFGVRSMGPVGDFLETSAGDIFDLD